MVSSILTGAQVTKQSANLHGTIRDRGGNPVSQAEVVLQKKDSPHKVLTNSGSDGSYTFPRLTEGVYNLHAAKTGNVDAQLDSIFIGPNESKTVDLTLGTLQPARASTTPQFFDPPQFTVAGVTDTTALGGHGSDSVVRTRDSLAKETVSLSSPGAKAPSNATQEKSLRDAAEREPADFNANHQLGRWLIEANRPQEAISYLERAATRDPSNYENAYDLALANASAGNNTAARNAAEKLLASQDTADLHHLLGDVDEKLGDSLDAVRHYQRAAELEPSEPHLFEWGAELLLHHAPEPAEEVFSRGIKTYPNSSRMLIGLGATSFARGNTDDAIRRICQASDLNPSESAPYLFLGRIEQAEIVPPDELLNKLHRFVTLQPQSADANYYYALAIWKQRNRSGNADTASQVESLLKSALQIDPKYAPAELQLGILHAHQDAYTQAISDYQKAIQINPQLEEAHYRLARAYRQVGESQKAEEELRIYLQLSKESAQKLDRERREIKQFVYTLRDQSAPAVR